MDDAAAWFFFSAHFKFHSFIGRFFDAEISFLIARFCDVLFHATFLSPLHIAILVCCAVALLSSSFYLCAIANKMQKSLCDCIGTTI